LRRARHRRPPLQTLQYVLPEPATQKVEDAAIADPLRDPAEQPLVRDAVEASREF